MADVNATACANPLLLAWLEEMYATARERNTKGVTTYRKACESMRACPLTFAHPSEAVKLDGIGPKICDVLTRKLVAHCEANKLPPPALINTNGGKRTGSELQNAVDEDPATSKRQRKIKAYLPSRRSGAYAMMLALSVADEESLQSYTKAQVIELAQPHCDSSLTMPSDPSKHYSAWNSMTTLIKKDLVQERGRPVRLYTLTEEGWEVAKRIRAAEGLLKIDVSGNTRLDEYFDESAPPVRKDAEDQTLNGRSALAQISGNMKSFDGALDADVRTAQSKTSSAINCPPSVSKSTRSMGNDGHVVDLLSSPEPDSRSQDNANNDSEIAREAHGTRTRSAQLLADKNPTDLRNSLAQVPNSIEIPAGTFHVRLVLDNREVFARNERQHMQDELRRRGVTPLVRPLPLGDICWIAEIHNEELLKRKGVEKEVVLDWIVERKRLDDLVGSIKDGRFAEQKFRLHRSGILNVIYLIEHLKLSKEVEETYGEAMKSAIASTQTVDGFFLKYAQNVDESIRYLARMTALLKTMYEDKPLHILPSSSLSPANYLPLLSSLRSDPIHVKHKYNIYFSAFASLVSKSDSLTVRDVFLKMLMCTRGISGDKALAIQKVWPTPRSFIEALEKCSSTKEKQNLIEWHLGDLVGRGKIKGVLGAKIAEIWS